jgi:aspartate-semialdehyde dehydrogenase
MSAGSFRVAVVGATGAVGGEMRRLLDERNFPVRTLRLFTSPRSAGQKFVVQDREWTTEVLSEGCFEDVDVALFSAGAAVSREWGPKAVESGALVVDNSSAFRMDPGTPLVVPEINPHALRKPPTLIANPNCSTIQMVVALKPLRDLFGLSRVIVSTYQSVSGAGRSAMEELLQQTEGYLKGNEPAPSRFPHPIAFNLIPQVDEFGADGYTREEWKMVNETRKILEIPGLPVTATCVRVPVLRGHSEMVWAAFQKPVDLPAARQALSSFPGIVLQDEPEARGYPLPRAAGATDPVYVGRLRKDPSDPNALVFWVVSDNLLKGAALNAIQIAEVTLGVVPVIIGR